MINPDITCPVKSIFDSVSLGSVKKFSLILVMMLIMFLALSTSPMAGTYSGGSGTSGDPYQIANLNDLQEISTTTADWGAYFIQTADIDASATSGWNGGAGFSSIGNGGGADSFTGTYNGQNHTISGIYIDRPGTDNIGLFGFVRGAAAVIENIGVTNADISGQNNVGAIAGYIYDHSTISSCFSTGSVSGNSHVGGLVGDNRNGNTITFCYSRVATRGVVYLGGFVGQNSNNVQDYPNILDCYSTGDVTIISGNDHRIGGFIGENYDAILQNCYSTGRVISVEYADPTDKGFAGQVLGGGPISNNFWDTETSLQSTSKGGDATGKTTAEMKTQSTFTDAGWDFTTPDWKIDGINNSGYPFLNWQATLATVTTQAVSAITSTTATGNGTITDLGAPSPTAHGMCWNTTGTPTIDDSHTEEGAASATGTFTSTMTGLVAGTTYHVRAYATNTGGTAYGDEISYTHILPPGNALDFDGSNDTITASQSPAFEMQTFTIESWIKLDPTTADGRHCIASYGYGGAGINESIAFTYRTDLGGRFRLRLMNSGGSNFMDLLPAYPVASVRDTWVHAAVTWDGATATIYINGKSIGSDTAAGIINFPSDALTKLRIGNWFGNDERWLKGNMDEVRIWNDVRTIDEIRSNMYKELASSESNLVAYYKFNEMDLTTPGQAVDSSGNGHHGTYEGDMIDADSVTSGAFSGPRNCLDFDGTDDYVDCGAGAVVLGNTFTQEAWIYPVYTGEGVKYHGFLGYEPSSGGAGYRAPGLWVLENEATPLLSGIHYGFGADGEWCSALVEAVITNNAWNHVATTFDGTNYRLYVNGKEVNLDIRHKP